MDATKAHHREEEEEDQEDQEDVMLFFGRRATPQVQDETGERFDEDFDGERGGGGRGGRKKEKG